MSIAANRNYIWASHLIRISVGIDILTFILVYLQKMGQSLPFSGLFVPYLTLTFLVVVAFLLRKGFGWAKWLYLAFFIFGIVNDALHGFATEKIMFQSAINAAIEIPEAAIEIATLALLFIPGIKDEVDLDETGIKSPVESV